MAKKRFVGRVGRCVADTQYAYEDIPSKRRADAPNVLYIVLDDLGFAQLGCYGSNIDTPNIDRLAENGLRYNNFHTTAICSATRASLLTGANHHSVGVNATVEMVTGCNNGTGEIDRSYATLAEILREFDYDTYACGKWHLAGMNEVREVGSFDNWPLGKGFENYYGFLAAHNDQWHPTLTRDNTMVDQPKEPKDGYHAYKDQMKDKHAAITFPAVHRVYKNVAYPYDLPADSGMSSRTNVITIIIDRKSKDEQGVLISSGDRFGGSSIYVLNNRLHYVYNLYGETFYHAISNQELPLGQSTLKVAFTVTGKGKATVELYINEAKTGETAIEEFNYMTMGVTSFRVNKHTAVNEADYQAPFEYVGEIKEIDIDVEESKAAAKDIVEKDLHAD